MDGIFIPMEFFDIKELNHTECLVLAIYKYYTENGKYKCCSLTKYQIAEELNISADYLKKIKKHLIELGLIRTSGIKVIYVGKKGGNIVPILNKEETPQGGTIVPQGGYQSTQGGYQSTHQGGNIVPNRGVTEYPHKKEKEDKKRNKKEKEEGMEILEQLLKQDDEDFFDKLIDEHKDYQNNTIDLF